MVEPEPTEGVAAGSPLGATIAAPLVRSASFLILNQAVVSGLGFLFWILAARSYPQGAVGEAATLISAAVFISVLAGLGLPYALVRHLTNCADPKALVRSILATCALGSFLLGAAAILLMAQLVPSFAFLREDPALAALFLALVVFWAVESPLEQAFVAARRAESGTAMLSVFAVLRLPLVLLAVSGLAEQIVGSWTLAMAVAVGVGALLLLPRALRGVAPAEEGRQPTLRALVKYGAANNAGNILTIAAPLLLPALILGAIGGQAGRLAAAQFYLALSIAQLLHVVPAAVALAQFAEGARPSANLARDRQHAFGMAYALVIPGVVLMAVLAAPLLSLFGTSYAEGGAHLLVLFVVSSVAIVPETILATRLRLVGDLRPVILAAAIASGVTITGSALFLQVRGLEAVGWSFLLGHSVGAILLAAWPAPRAGAPLPAPSLPAAAPAQPGDRASRAVVMVLNWNSGDYLKKCIDSLLAAVSPATRIVVLDNGSSDGSIAVAQAAGPRIETMLFGRNLGYTGAYNRGIAAVDEEYIVLLNPDTVVDQLGWVERLVAIADEDPTVAAVACKLVFMDEPSRINSAGGMVYWWSGPVDVGFGLKDRGEFGPDFQPFAASGGAMLVRRTTFIELGGFDDAMFAFIEDVDLGWRMRLRGMRVAFAHDVVVKHKFSGIVGGISPLKVYLTNRNFLRAMLRNYSATTLVFALPAYALWTAAKIAGGLFVERSPKLVGAVIRSVGWNLRHLSETLEARRAIQETRVLGDREIMRKMGPQGFEPWPSVRRRLAVSRGQLAGADA